ncbi:MAG: SDR family NAD(P)-dependent oxidoreductase [Spirochaetales bacterium]|nr:MAG: SDR family NAD(P)-dependent oxidoreductase [Spirochaetales bacterium]
MEKPPGGTAGDTAGSRLLLSLAAADPAADRESAAAEILGQLLVPWSRHLETFGRPPRLVEVEGTGFFSVSKTYDEAGEGTASKEAPPAEPDRNSVVRGKIAVVTGGAQGFGEGIVREFLKAGAFVWIADLNAEGAAGLSDELNGQAGKTMTLPVSVNVTDETSVAAMVDTITAAAGGFDIFVNNAGVLKAGSVKTMDLASFKFVTEVNYTGYFLCAKYASRVMAMQNLAAQKSGSAKYFSDIIQINSKSGLEGSNRNGAYAGGKFGGLGLTQSFALELVEDNIKVNSVCPGNFFEGPLWSDPEKGLFVQYLKAGKIPGARSIEDVKAFYEAKVPMKRGCLAGDVVKAMFYIIEQKYETGQAVPVTGGQIMLK